jgi:hypothetical protein
VLGTEVNSELGGKALARIAHEKGWKNIYIEGAEEFKRAAWREASSRDMDVDGYRPDGRDVTETRDRAMERGMDAPDAARMAEAKAVRSGYGAPEMTESEKAHALKNMPPSQVLEKYPELAKECALIQALEAKINSNISDPYVRAEVMKGIREEVAISMDRGQKMPEVTISQVKQAERERTKERAVSVEQSY